MKLKVQQLKAVVERALEDERLTSLVKEEVSKIAPRILTEDRRLGDICEDLVHEVDVARHSNQNVDRLKTSTVLRLVESKDANARLLAAMWLPQNQLHKLMNDPDDRVTYEVAERISLRELNGMLKRRPDDDQLELIYNRRLSEAEEREGVMPALKKLGSTVKQNKTPTLSDFWYDEMAEKIIASLGGNIYHNGIKLLAQRYAATMKQSSGVEVDVNKLYDSIDELISTTEDGYIAKSPLKESIDHVNRSMLLEEEFFVYGDQDAVEELVESKLSISEYIEKFENVFGVTYGAPPKNIRRGVMAEGLDVSRSSFPTHAEVPHSDVIRSIDEKALSKYVECWNRKSKNEGSKFRIDWTYDGTIGFEVSI
jgi:hypothetical protein